MGSEDFRTYITRLSMFKDKLNFILKSQQREMLEQKGRSLLDRNVHRVWTCCLMEAPLIW